MLQMYPRKRFLSIVSLICLLSFSSTISAQISTFAGRHTYLGDGGLATAAGLFGPYAMAKDAAGNIYIATSQDNRVREINITTKVITTVAGTGIAGYSGDGGPATAAKFSFNNNYPGIAVDKSGNVYIGDYGNDRVRKITAATGIVTTVAGTGVDNYSGDGGAAVAATMSGPAGVAVDTAGNVYFADNNNCVIRKITISTGKISTVVGSYANGGAYSGDGGPATSAGLSYPERIAIDAGGNIYIADQDNFLVRKVTAATQIITTVAGSGTKGTTGDGGAATSATLGYIKGLAVDAAGNIYIADPTYNCVRKVTAATKIISTVAGSSTAGYSGDGGAATAALLTKPSDVMLDNSGNLYIDDFGNNVVRLITTSTGIITTALGDGTNGFTGVQPALKAQLAPQGVALSANGDLLIADGYYYDVRDINVAGTALIYAGNPNPDPAFASKGYGGNGGIATFPVVLLNAPVGVATDASNNVYIADVNNNVIRQVNYSSKYISNYAGTSVAGYSGDGAAATSATLKAPSGVATDKNGNVYIADAGNNRIRMVSATTKYISTVAGTGTAGFSGDGAAATAAQITNPTAVATDASGNIFFIDKGNARVRRIDATTKYISTILSNSHVLTGIATDANGNIYVSDSTASSVIKITVGTFAVQTIAGTGVAGYSGDGGASASAQLNYPGGLAIDASGYVYVADVNNSVIRKFLPSSVAKIAGNTISTVDSTITCDGKIILTTLTGTVPTGGSGTYTYQWKQSTDSVTFTTITGATAQNYAVNATITKATFYRRFVTSGALVDSGNALAFHPRTLPVPVITLKGAATFCQGLKDTLTATAGYIKYLWSNAATTNPIIDSISGTFTVTVTDSFGCKGTSASTVITVNASPATPTITSSPATTTGLCPGTTVTLTSSTGTTYKWSTGATTASIAVTAAGSYVDTVYNASGCKAYSAAKVVSYTTPATPTITSSPATTTGLCPGTTVTLTSSTGTTYKWSTGGTTASIAVTAAGSYVDTVYNASGCKAYSAPTVVSYTTAPATPTITSSPATTTGLCPGTTVTLTSSTGTTYKWSTGATTASIAVTAAGSYVDTVYNASGCKAYSAPTVVSYTTAPATPTITSSPATTTGLCPGTTVTLTSSTGTTYKWSTGATTASIAVTAAGSYVDTVYNASGCKAYSAPTVVSYTTAPATPTITSSPATTTGLCPGTTVTLTSSTGTTYKWSTGATTASVAVTAAGSYVDTVYNASGCKAYSAPTVVSYTTAPATPTITSSPATTTGLCPGTTVTLTSSTGTTYKWSTGATTASIAVTAAGSYVDTFYNASGCKAYSAPTVVSYTTAPATPTITSSPATTTGLCPGTTVTLTSSTGTTYKWSTGATTASIAVTAAGSYVDTVYNASGCKAYSAPTVVSHTTAPAMPTITSSPATTTGLCPGTTVTLTSSTGTTYKWSTGATTASIAVTAAGSYVDTVYNGSGCKAYSAPTVVSYVTCATPASPVTVSYTGLTATLKWAAVPCAVAYYLQYAPSSATTWTTITVSGTVDTTYQLTGLTKSTAYKWQVASVCTTSPSVTTSGYTSPVTFTTTAATSAVPGNVAITADLSAKKLLYNNAFDAIVYPNPAINTANIQLNGVTGKVLVMVTDLLGKVVYRTETTAAAKQLVVPVGNFTAGMYFITVKDEQHSKVLKLLKQ